MKKQKGYTFIEILVVITIIAVLTAIGVVNFRVANRKGRDGRRQSDLEQIRAALELYRTDQGAYPASVTFGGSFSYNGTTYMEKVPEDPLEDYDYSYSVGAFNTTYTLCAALELETTGTCSVGSCGTGITCNYELTNPL